MGHHTHILKHVRSSANVATHDEGATRSRIVDNAPEMSLEQWLPILDKARTRHRNNKAEASGAEAAITAEIKKTMQAISGKEEEFQTAKETHIRATEAFGPKEEILALETRLGRKLDDQLMR